MHRNSIGAAAAWILASLAISANACSEVSGNWYCNPVDAIEYSNVGAPGSYNQVNSMANGKCTSAPKSYSGPLSPLDEEVSFHFRGPLQLKQFAAYTPGTGSKEKREEGSTARRRRAHKHLEMHAEHGAKHDIQEGNAEKHEERGDMDNAGDAGPVATAAPIPRDAGQPAYIVATINGDVVSWPNSYYKPSPSAAQATPSTQASAQHTTSVCTSETTSLSKSEKPSSTKPSSVKTSSTKTSASGSQTTATGTVPGSYNRIGYYNSAKQTLDGLVFLGNYGGQGSGVWDTTWGNSLAYCDTKGSAGAASPQILADITLPSNKEFTIMLDEECGKDGCGFVRPGTVAYHGFDGADKVFLMEFGMPSDGQNGFNADMPAIWLLNAQIPRTAQYGSADCSCWTSGCGEFDIAETLHSGSTYMKSTLHSNHPGGASDYFVRPTSGTMKMAVTFSSASSTIHIQVLDDEYDFPTSLTADHIESISKQSSGSKLSKFPVV